MSNSIVYLNSPDGIHNTYGISILTKDKYTAENFLYVEILPLCKKLACRYFIQGLDITEFKTSWVYVEFFGEGDENKILNLIQEFNKTYGYIYYSGEVLFEEPSTELLRDLNLI